MLAVDGRAFKQPKTEEQDIKTCDAILSGKFPLNKLRHIATTIQLLVKLKLRMD